MPPQLTYAEIRPIADVAADTYDLDALALLSIFWLESSWRPEAVNESSWATGLGGVLSHESAAIYGNTFADRPTVEELKDPAVNADWSASILADNLERYDGDLRKAVKAYSGGWGVAGDTAFDTQYWKPFEAKLQALRKEHYMDMSKYPRPANDTGAGVHSSAGFTHPFGENEGLWVPLALELRARGLTWAKLGDMGGSSIKVCKVLLEQGIMPVVRMYQQRPSIHHLEQKEKETLVALGALGVHYIEDDNERNLVEEWPDGQWPGAGMPFGDLVAAWYERGQYVTSLGMFYAIPSLAPGGNFDDITYLANWLRAAKLLPEALSLLHDWGWVSVHPAALTHPLAYPDDEVNQLEHPGQSIHTHYYANGSPTGASNCWRKWEAVEKIVTDILGFPLPILATEGGAWPGKHDSDIRYPALSEQEASDRQATMLRFMASAPAYFIANMPWLLANREMGNLAMQWEDEAWMQAGGHRLPIWEMLRLAPCQKREVTTVPETPTTPTTPTTPYLTRIREALWNALYPGPIPYNPGAAFQKAAKTWTLSVPVTREIDIDGYRAQGFALGFVYCQIGQWQNVQRGTWQ